MDTGWMLCLVESIHSVFLKPIESRAITPNFVLDSDVSMHPQDKELLFYLVAFGLVFLIAFGVVGWRKNSPQSLRTQPSVAENPISD